MTVRLKGLRDQRGKAIADGRAILDKAETEARDLTPEELDAHGNLYAEQESLGNQIKAEERQADLDRTAAEDAARAADEAGRNSRIPEGGESRGDAAVMAAFGHQLRSGHVAADAPEEYRALQAGADTEGGYLVPPEEFVRRLIKFIDDMVFIRARATVFQVANADSLGIPTLDTDPADADWTSELATGSEDSSMAFGKRSLHPHPLAKLLKISNKLIGSAALSPEQLALQRLGYKFGITEEKADLTGSGSGEPLGIYTASSDGISTGRDVSTGNTTTKIQFDGLIEAKYSVKAAYWPNCVWNFHRTAMKEISKLKDGDQQYLWRPSVREGEPDTILGHPVDVSEYTPNTFTAGLYVGAFADFSNYWIADSLAMTIQRLVELYARTNQVGFIGRLETDGMPVLEEAFARVTLAP